MSFWTSSTAQCPDPEKAAHGSCNPRYETLRKTANTDPLYLQVFTIPPESGRNITKFCVPSAWLFFILFFFGQNLAVFPPTSRQTRVAAARAEAEARTEAAAFAAPDVAGEGAVQAAGDVGHGQDASEDPGEDGEDGAGEGTEEALWWLWINTY